ncbi:MAG: septum site-determining protein MinC [bacterium]|nr:septum site-determining protein MinC [bacterium]
MHNIEHNHKIDLTSVPDSQSLVDKVVSSLESLTGKSCEIELNMDKTEINQSQMVFIKSLIQSYGHNLSFVETTNPLTRDICIEMGIRTGNSGFFADRTAITEDIKNAKLDELREEFKSGFENKQTFESTEEETRKEECEAQTEQNNEETLEIKEEVKEENESEDENKPEQVKAVEVIKEEIQDETEVQKQVIGVYRKADEKENEAEFQDEDVDFYATPTDESVVIDTKDTIYVNQTLRNGQVLDYDGNVVIIGDCHPGSEIKATGDITVWGVLGSIAHAGIKGNQDARIRALKMNAVQLRIANCYSRRPDGGNIPYIAKTSVFTPEEARIVDDNIVLFKMAQN